MLSVDNFVEITSNECEDRTTTRSIFVDQTRVGGSRDVYHGNVNQSQQTITFGDNAQTGGIRSK